jgi:DNA-binding NtrC family response regulator
VILRGDGERLWRRLDFWPFHDQNDGLIGLLGQVREPAAISNVPDSKAHQLRVQLLQLREQLHRSFGFESLVGTGPAHARLLEQVRIAAANAVPVLIVGEPGTGKRLVARVIHELGARRHRPLIPLDCEALPAEVIERELFRPRQDEETSDSHPAQGDSLCLRSGLALPEGSTLLIGEILALPRDLQLRLASALDGDVRVIATTAGDPEAALQAERLRPELYHGMTVLELRIKPLRQRREDLPLLAQHLLERVNQRVRSHCGAFTPQALSALEAYDWPGNVRELARVIDAAHERAHAQPRRQNPVCLIEEADLPASIRGNLGAAYLPPLAERPVKPLDELLTEIERRLIETALAKARQNKSRAAELLGISRPRLYRRIKELNLPDETETEAEPLPAATPAAI